MITKEWLVDTKTDAQRIFHSVDAVIDYLIENGLGEGDALWDYSNELRVRVRIPAFFQDQNRYGAAKQVACDRWGCN